ncbi:uncharacterized protein BJ171DRAFT_586258 [Polychytrium aggregatum]|uniref:uncharacterized protein n=1 Tax=Polychytrium aggregatum TaxID=110093 RepID=UPI0022FEB190|nr:uncharacterized protein BJ171DRAFT_586258 [Polychytrium aggregatum]KAI9197130.1 hypothetical protein BJ171DRAFT_586258 [Polychytrium aggregatum]
MSITYIPRNSPSFLQLDEAHHGSHSWPGLSDDSMTEFELEKSLRINFLKAFDMIRRNKAPAGNDSAELHTAFNTIVNSGLFHKFFPHLHSLPYKGPDAPLLRRSSSVSMLSGILVQRTSRPSSPCGTPVTSNSECGLSISAITLVSTSSSVASRQLCFEDESPQDRQRRLSMIRLSRSWVGRRLAKAIDKLETISKRVSVVCTRLGYIKSTGISVMKTAG